MIWCGDCRQTFSDMDSASEHMGKAHGVLAFIMTRRRDGSVLVPSLRVDTSEDE
jgi:uncharacterized C2H2 Zn-finger protein